MMCTVVMSVRPDAEVPVLLAGIRDEFVDRAWRPPDAHWPARPDLTGGLDLHAGGTWLAVNSTTPRVAAVLNGRGQPAPMSGRRTRGELPLRVAAEGDPALVERDLRCFDPFQLVLAEPDHVRLWSWAGDRVTTQVISPGVHMITSTGLDRIRVESRVAYHLPRFAEPPFPAPAPGEPCDRAWGRWPALLSGSDLDADDDRAIVVRRQADGRAWGSTSATLVAVRATGLRYDFSANPGDRASWETVLDIDSVDTQ